MVGNWVTWPQSEPPKDAQWDNKGWNILEDIGKKSPAPKGIDIKGGKLVKK